MTERLDTVLEKISTIPNPVNSSLIQEFYQFMTDNRKSDSYKKNNLKALVPFSHELAPNVTFYDIQKILEFLNKRIKPKSVDPNEKWVTTWNDYLGRLKFSFRCYTITRSTVWRELPADMLEDSIRSLAS
jgi:integrase/recombinase XerD